MASSEIRLHWNRVAALDCIVCGGHPTLHHCHGGSLREVGIHKGLGQKTSDWLVIPLCPLHHTGQWGIDLIGVVAWEEKFGPQLGFLREVCSRLRVNVFEKAGYPPTILQQETRSS